MQYAISARIPLVEGLVVNTNGGVIDTRTEVANSLHPLTGLSLAHEVIIKIWDTAVGGTPKVLTTYNINFRIGGGAGWLEAQPWDGVGGFFHNGSSVQGKSVRSGAVLYLKPVVWGAAAVPANFLGIDDFALRIVTDATTNPGTFWADAYVIRHIG